MSEKLVGGREWRINPNNPRNRREQENRECVCVLRDALCTRVKERRMVSVRDGRQRDDENTRDSLELGEESRLSRT